MVLGVSHSFIDKTHAYTQKTLSIQELAYPHFFITDKVFISQSMNLLISHNMLPRKISLQQKSYVMSHLESELDLELDGQRKSGHHIEHIAALCA